MTTRTVKTVTGNTSRLNKIHPTAGKITCRLNYKKIKKEISLSALSQTISEQKSASIIGGNSSVEQAGRYSFWACEPKEIFEVRTGILPFVDPVKKLQAILDKYRLEEKDKAELPDGIFVGGWIGYLSYELGYSIEEIGKTKPDKLQLPLIRLCFYDRVICYDHTAKTFWLLALQFPNDPERPENKIGTLEKLITLSEGISPKTAKPVNMENIDVSKIRCNMGAEEYLNAVKKIKKHIYDGDVYQINFSQCFECDFQKRPIDLFNWENLYNPSPYSTYISDGSFHIVGASPEMFIKLKDRTINTKPIKGTRPRIQSTENHTKKINERNFNELAASEKEQAELNMIIDLERNDLGRICRYGTIRVAQPRTIEAYPTVFHAVSTIEGKLRDAITFSDILRAMFPGGSITGAPKISAMKIIHRLEPTPRGVYTGSIGFIGIDGSACLNIAIRTIIVSNNTAFIQTGGGIVADSEPKAEWDETLVKARALVEGIRAVMREE